MHKCPYKHVFFIPQLSETFKCAVLTSLFSCLILPSWMPTSLDTETALLAVIGAPQKGQEYSMPSVFILLNLSAAFDTNHKIIGSYTLTRFLIYCNLPCRMERFSFISSQPQYRSSYRIPEVRIWTVVVVSHTKCLGSVIRSHSFSDHWSLVWTHNFSLPPFIAPLLPFWHLFLDKDLSLSKN